MILVWIDFRKVIQDGLTKISNDLIDGFLFALD
jgi:hypothetical protein